MKMSETEQIKIGISLFCRFPSGFFEYYFNILTKISSIIILTCMYINYVWSSNNRFHLLKRFRT